MKREISIERPSYLEAAWPGKYKLFSWLEYAANIPYPIFIITTLKENGKANACLHSWGCFGGDDGGYYSILTIRCGAVSVASDHRVWDHGPAVVVALSRLRLRGRGGT